MDTIRAQQLHLPEPEGSQPKPLERDRWHLHKDDPRNSLGESVTYVVPPSKTDAKKIKATIITPPSLPERKNSTPASTPANTTATATSEEDSITKFNAAYKAFREDRTDSGRAAMLRMLELHKEKFGMDLEAYLFYKDDINYDSDESSSSSGSDYEELLPELEKKIHTASDLTGQKSESKVESPLTLLEQIQKGAQLKAFNGKSQEVVFNDMKMFTNAKHMLKLSQSVCYDNSESDDDEWNVEPYGQESVGTNDAVTPKENQPPKITRTVVAYHPSLTNPYANQTLVFDPLTPPYLSLCRTNIEQKYYIDCKEKIEGITEVGDLEHSLVPGKDVRKSLTFNTANKAIKQGNKLREEFFKSLGEAGRKLVEEGKKLVEEGEKLIEKDESLEKEGKQKIEDGRKKIKEGSICWTPELLSNLCQSADQVNDYETRAQDWNTTHPDQKITYNKDISMENRNLLRQKWTDFLKQKNGMESAFF